MATINTASIEGFDNMSAEDKVKALLGVEIPEAPNMEEYIKRSDIEASGYVKKSTFDAKASEAAELSKKLKGKMTEEELAQAERERIKLENEQKYNDLEEKFNQLVKSSRIAEYKAKYIAQGYDEKLAESTAKALEEGDMAKVFENANTYKAELEKKIKAEVMKGDPHPGGSAGKDKDGEGNAAIDMAKKIGKQKAEENKTTADVMKHYL